jgi:4-amino-4-deoxy-L-arabinose transferase-like glycosyltransferase
VHWKADIALRYYQLHGGYTPGPVFLFGLLAGIAGIFTFRRRRDSGPALACLLVTGCAVAVLLGADLYEFSWRYQLPALVTLPVAGAFGVTALVGFFRARAQARRSGVAAVAGGATEAAGAVEAIEPVGAKVSGEPKAHERAARGRAAGDAAAEAGDAADELAVAGSEQTAP